MLAKSVFKVSSLTMVSRVFGFIRDILTAAFLGAGPIADAFFVAFRLPNFFRSFFAEGAFSAAFVPIYSRLLTQKDKNAALLFAEQSLAVLVTILVVFIALAEIFMPYVMLVIAPGFSDDPAKFDLVVFFSRITFPYLLFISIVAVLGGVLNSLNHFAAFAAAPIVLNLVLITALVGLTPYLPSPGHAMAAGVFAAGVAQTFWMMWGCKIAKARIRPRMPKLSPEVKRLGKLVLPGAVGAGVMQLNLLIGVIIASFLPEGSVSYLYYADRIAQLPLGVIGVAIGTALLPLLTKQLRSGDEKDAANSQNRAIEMGLLLTVPAAISLLVIPDVIIATLFERGAFDPQTTKASAAALMALGAGVPAYVLVKILGPGFFAREDTKTPVKVAIVSVVINLVLNLLLMGPLLHVGIALATAIAAWANAMTLMLILIRRRHLKFDTSLKSNAPKIITAAIIMGGVLYGLKGFVFNPAATITVKIIGLIALVLIGKFTYFALTYFSGAINVKLFLKRLRQS